MRQTRPISKNQCSTATNWISAVVFGKPWSCSNCKLDLQNSFDCFWTGHGRIWVDFSEKSIRAFSQLILIKRCTSESAADQLFSQTLFPLCSAISLCTDTHSYNRTLHRHALFTIMSMSTPAPLLYSSFHNLASHKKTTILHFIKHCTDLVLQDCNSLIQSDRDRLHLVLP